MNYQKLDASMLLLLNNAEPDEGSDDPGPRSVADPTERCLPVFVQLAETLQPEALETLKAMGIGDVSDRRRTYTATLSRQDLEQLSEQPWVRGIKAAQQLKPIQSPTP
jgi:hypothetical protein